LPRAGPRCCFFWLEEEPGPQFQANEGQVAQVGRRRGRRGTDRVDKTTVFDEIAGQTTMNLLKSDDRKKTKPKKIRFESSGEAPRLYYEVGEADLWLSGRDPSKAPHCAALCCFACFLLAQGWSRLRAAGSQPAVPKQHQRTQHHGPLPPRSRSPLTAKLRSPILELSFLLFRGVSRFQLSPLPVLSCRLCLQRALC